MSQHESIAAALGRIPSGLFVVTARRDGQETAFLASWIMQAGFRPPSLSVAVGRDRPALAFLREAGSRFAVSVIGEGERGMLGPFTRGVAPGPDALANLGLESGPAGQAVLKGCLAWLECRSTGGLETGDHVVVTAEITAAGGRLAGEPTVHVRRSGLDY
jgi:flavin reductase (DIM6/NTAB) family NADH-FMN oxidoreductase RutF